jgi:hypothetical protein
MAAADQSTANARDRCNPTIGITLLDVQVAATHYIRRAREAIGWQSSV